MLREQGDGVLRAVGLDEGEVEVVQEEEGAVALFLLKLGTSGESGFGIKQDSESVPHDDPLSSHPYLRRPVLAARALVDGQLHLPLQRCGVGVVAHLDGRGPNGGLWCHG